MNLLPLYFYGEQVNELTGMSVDWVALAVAIGGVIGIWVKMEVSMKAIQVRQDATEKTVEILQQMVQTQIEVDNIIKDVLSDLRVGQEKLDGKISTISARFERHQKHS